MTQQSPIGAPRIPPLTPGERDAGTAELLTSVGPLADLNIFATLVRHARLFKRWVPFGTAMLYGYLGDRAREILVLRTAYLVECAYETSQHVRVAATVGLTPEEIAGVSSGSATGLSPLDSALMSAAQEMVDQHMVCDATWQVLAEQFDDRLLVEIPMVVAHYYALGLVLNTLGVQPELGDNLVLPPRRRDQRAMASQLGGVVSDATPATQRSTLAPAWRPRVSPVPLDDPSSAELLAPLGERARSHFFRTLVRHQRIYKRWGPYSHSLFRGALPPRDRELLVLRAAFYSNSGYLSSQHERIASTEGFTDEELRRIRQPIAEGCWSASEAVLLRAVDELVLTHTLSDDLWNVLAERYDVPQLIEIPMVVGVYVGLGFTLNTLGVEPEVLP